MTNAPTTETASAGHAASANMPKKWFAHIHGDLLAAFAHLAEIAHQERGNGRN